MNPGLKPTFKYAGGLNSPVDVQASDHAKAHGLKLINQLTDTVNNLGNMAHNDSVLQKLG